MSETLREERKKDRKKVKSSGTGLSNIEYRGIE